MPISETRPTRFAWTIENGVIRLGFDPVGTLEAVCRVDFAPNKTLTGDEELFPDFDTENIAWAYILEMLKAALLQQRIMRLDAVNDAAEIQGLQNKLVMLLGNGKVVGTVERERKTVKMAYLERDGMNIVLGVPYFGSNTVDSDYGELP